MTQRAAKEKLIKQYCKNRAWCELYGEHCKKENCEIYHAIKALEAEPIKHGVIELTYEEYGELCSYALPDEPKHGRCNTCRYMTKDELCTRYDDENGTHSTMPEGYCWLWERRMDEVEKCT